MALDPSIILGGRAPDILGAMQQGNALAQQTLQARQQNALAGFMRDNGQGLLAGDANALAGLAQFDPTMALNIQTQNRNNARADQEWQLKAQEYAQKVGAERAAALAAQTESAVKMGLGLPDAATWDVTMASQAPDLVGKFDQREAIAQQYLSIADILKRQGGAGFRQATPDEAAAYGAAAGQFGPDGRFYPINPPSGLAIETGPDGQMRVVQGSGAGSAAGKPFTEGQSKDNVFATRAEGALAALDPVAGALTDRGDIVAEGVPMGLARGTQSDNFQLARQAGDEFLQAILRKDTGAAITPDEQALYGKTYLPQPGDSDAVMVQKAQARRRALEALKSGMSPAQMVAQERALQESGSAQVPPVDGGPVSPPAQRRRYNPQTGEFE